MSDSAGSNAVPRGPNAASRPSSHIPLLSVRGLRKTFRPHRFSRKAVHAVRDMSFDIEAGQTVAVVGESGSGKSTCARLILRLIEPDAGTVTFEGQELTGLRRQAMSRVRQNMPMVFQDPYSSIDPTWTIGEVVVESRFAPGRARAGKGRAGELLVQVGLPAEFVDRYPYELSGGQRQRVAIARALACDPRLLICDEAVSALDVSTRAGIINLLQDLQRQHGFGILFITHDLSLVEVMSDRVVIVYHGEVVETGVTSQVYADPRHAYTKLLLASIPRPDPTRRMDLAAFAGSSRPYIE